MVADVRVGGAFITMGAQAGPYVAGIGAATAANRRLIASYGGFNAALALSNRAFDRLSASITSSLIATLGYAAGVGLVAGALRNVFGGFLDYDQALIRISKTTGVANEELERLGENLSGIGTRRFQGRRPLDISRRDIFDIAVAAGQAGVADPREIERLTRAAGALQSSSDLIGTAAVRAITRYLQVTNQGIERTDAIASAFTHLGNNIVGTEAEISRFATRVAQNMAAVGQASDEFILGISASLLEAGIEMESAGSALQRAQLGVIRQAADPAAFRFIAQAAGESVDEFEALRQRFVDGTATAEDYDQALLAVLRTYRRLPAVTTDALPGRAQFLAAFVGGGEQNVRNTRVLATLARIAEEDERLLRNTRIAAEGLESQSAHFTEAERAAEAYRARLEVVGRQLEEFATNLGGGIVPAVTVLAENLDLLGIAALGATTALATGFGRRRVQAIREASRAARAAAQAEHRTAQQGLVSARQQQREQQRLVDTLRQRQAIGANARAQLASQEAVLAARIRATEVAHRSAAAAAQARGRAVGAAAGLGTTTGLGTGAVAAARAEVERRTALVAEQQRRVVALRAAAADNQVTQRQLNRELRRLERRTVRANAAMATFNQTQAAVASQSRTLVSRLRGLGGSLFALAGGPLGLFIGGLAAAPLLINAFTRSLSALEERARAVREELQPAIAEQQREETGLTPTGFQALSARQVIEAFQEEQLRILENLRLDGFLERLERQIRAGTSSSGRQNRLTQRLQEFFNRFQAGDFADLDVQALTGTSVARFIDQIDELSRADDEIRQTVAVLEELGLTAEDVGELAADGIDMAAQAFESLGPSTRRAFDTFQNFRRALDDSIRDAGTEARFEISTAGLAAVEQIQRRLIENERVRIAQFQRANQLSAEQAAAALTEAEARRGELADRVEALDFESEAREEAERALQAAEQQVTQAEAQVAVTRVLAELSDGLTVSAERQVELGRLALEQRRAQIAAFDAATARQVAGAAPDLDAVALDAFRERLELQNRLDDAQRDVTQAREIDAEASVAHQQALREYYEVLNAGADAERAAQQALLVNERARELAARRVLELADRRAAAGDRVTDALLNESRAAETRLARLRAEQHELELTAAAAVLMREEYERIARASAALVEAQRQNPFADLVLSAEELNESLDQVAAQGISSLADGLAELVVRGKADFRDLADSIIQELLRVFIQATIVNNLVSGLGLAGTGGTGGLAAIFGNIFHEGGRTESGGQRRQLRGLRSDELFAVLQKGEVVVPRHLASHLLSGNFDALRGWLARLPRYHEGGVAGGGHLPREDVTRLIAAINQLISAVQQLQLSLGRGAEPVAGVPARAQQAPGAGLPLGAQTATAPVGGVPVQLSETDRGVQARILENIAALYDRLGIPTDEASTQELREFRIASIANDRERDRLQEELVREQREQRRFAESRGEGSPIFREQQTLDPALYDDFRERFPSLIRELERQRAGAQDISFGGLGGRRVGDTPRPDLFPAGDNAIMLFRDQSASAFAESGQALTDTFGAAGVAGTVLNEETGGLLEGVFSEGGLMGQLVGESEGLMSGLFNSFGGGLSEVLNSVLGGLGGGGLGGIFGIFGSLFGFHGGGDVGPGAQRYHRPSGLRHDELLAVLQRGEIVLPRGLADRLRYGGYQSLDDLRSMISRLPRYHAGGHVGGGHFGGMGGGGPSRIELINQTNTPIEAVDNGRRIDAGDQVQSYILRDIRRNGPITQGMRLAIR